MAEYVLSRRADQDLFEISQYSISNFGALRAQQYINSLKSGMRMVAVASSVGKPYQTKNGTLFYRYDVGRHALFYQRTGDEVLIVRILHLMQDFDRHLS